MKLNPVEIGGREPLPEPLPAAVSRIRQKRTRLARRREMKEQGITPVTMQRVWLVRPSALLEIPDTYLKKAVQGLGSTPKAAWLRPNDARTLCVLDRVAGGRPIVSKTTYHYCEACLRPLLGREATERKRVVESGPEAYKLPCGASCDEDRITKTWEKQITNGKAYRRAA